MSLTEAQVKQRERKEKRRRASQSANAKREKDLKKRKAIRESKKRVFAGGAEFKPIEKPMLQDDDPVLAFAKTLILEQYEFEGAEALYPVGNKTPAKVLAVTVKHKKTGKLRTYELNYKKLQRDMLKEQREKEALEREKEFDESGD